MTLFPLDPVEAIRLRVAAVTAALRRRAMLRAMPRPAAQTGLQGAIWGDPVPVGAPARKKRATGRKTGPDGTASASSVFALAALGGLPVRLRRGTAPPAECRRPGRVILGEGVTRYRGASYGATREPTEEEVERERARRARQRPPKPSKAARTRSRKLLDLIGGEDG